MALVHHQAVVLESLHLAVGSVNHQVEVSVRHQAVDSESLQEVSANLQEVPLALQVEEVLENRPAVASGSRHQVEVLANQVALVNRQGVVLGNHLVVGLEVIKAPNPIHHQEEVGSH